MKAVLISLLALFSISATALEVGDRAPFVFVQGLESGDIDQMSPELMGKVIYVDFWAAWCAPCRISLPWMNEVKTRFKNRGFEIIAISTDEEREAGQGFVSSFEPNYLLGWDGASGAMVEAFEPKGMPTSYIIGRDGKITYIHSGFNEDDKAEIIAAIEAALAK